MRASLHRIFAPGLLLLAALHPGCRCPESSTPTCEVDPPTSIPSPAGTPRLLSMARDGALVALSWIDGAGDQARVMVARLDADGAVQGKPHQLGRVGPVPLISAVAVHGEQVAVSWMAGSRQQARIRGALLSRGAAPVALDLTADGPHVDPGVAFAGGKFWAIWGSKKTIQARPLAAGAPPPVVLVPRSLDAFWPLMVSTSDRVTLAYLTARGGYDLRVARASRVQQLARASSVRVPPKLHLRRLEPAVAAHGGDLLVAWSQVLPPPDEKPQHVRAARLTAAGKLEHYEAALQGLGPAVAAAPRGDLALGWLRPLPGGLARVQFGLLPRGPGEPQVLRVGQADLQNGRPALVRTARGHLLAWIRPGSRPGRRQLRLARVRCGR